MRKLARLTGMMVALLVLAAAGLEAYARFPPGFAVDRLAVPASARVLVLVLHGSGGRDEPTLVALERRLRELAAARPEVAVVRYIWSPHSDTRLRARVNGRRVGESLGEQLARRGAFTTIHVVSHSAGAYPAQALCESYRAATPAPARVVITFLDPIGFDGALNPGWGAGELGRCADYAEVVLNTDDPVPATNVPVENAWNIDVTARRPASADGHRWPVEWYLAQVAEQDVDARGYDHGARPRGGVAAP